MNTDKYDEWMESKAKLDFYKKKENDLRIEICDDLLADKPTGTHNFDIDGYFIKAVKKLNINLDEEILSFIWDDLTQEEQDCVKFKPALQMKIYKSCEIHNDLDQAITTKPAMPGLSIEIAED